MRAGAAGGGLEVVLRTPGCSGESWFSLLPALLLPMHTNRAQESEIPTRHTSHCKDWPVVSGEFSPSLAPSLPSVKGAGWFPVSQTSVQLELTLGSGLTGGYAQGWRRFLRNKLLSSLEPEAWLPDQL